MEVVILIILMLVISYIAAKVGFDMGSKAQMRQDDELFADILEGMVFKFQLDIHEVTSLIKNKSNAYFEKVNKKS